MLYNGERRWKAATATRELIAQPPDSELWHWQPQVRYHLLDMGAFPQGVLARRSSLVALLFRLEQRQSPDGLKDLLDEVIAWFQQHKGYERLQRLFTELIHEAFASSGVKLSRCRSLSEMRTMMSIDFESSKKQWIAKGEAKGVAKGQAEALIWLLGEKFGAVAPSRQKRIRGAKLESLERWIKRAIVAPDLRSVFNSQR